MAEFMREHGLSTAHAFDSGKFVGILHARDILNALASGRVSPTEPVFHVVKTTLAEVPLAAVVGGRVVSGTVDRLVIGENAIRIVDFKTARRPPTSLAEIPGAYVRQMAAYVAALEAIHPGVPVEAALLYTHTPALFVLPAELTETTAPEPADPRVRIRTVPESLTAVSRYSGRWSEASYDAHRASLLRDVAAAGLVVTGSPRFARFNPPFTPWFLRRNEVHVDVRDA